MLTKITVGAALYAELGNHLGYAKHELSTNENSLNSFSVKTLNTEDG